MKDAFTNRKYLIITFIVLVGLALIIRLFLIQVVEKTYRLSADNNVLRYVTQYPARGLIYDRNGRLMVSNQAAYDLMVVPAQTGRMDTALFCRELNITTDFFNERLRAAKNYNRKSPSIFLKQMSAETYAKFQEKIFMYPGFYVQPRTLRKYSRPVAAHLLGYISEVDEALIKKDPYYKMGDYIGKLGIEEAYEKELRGTRGVKIFMVDVFSRVKGSYADGSMDTLAVQGSDIISSIDYDLQEYGEMLMQNKTGSIVAIEPGTGEILALVSAPDYDPSLLVGRIRSENFARLQSDTALKPLFNRAFMASYPPGSTFKPINGLIALQEKVIVPSTEFGCSNGYHAGSLTVACHSHNSPLNLKEAIANSCNSYFCQAYRRILENPRYGSVAEAYDKWKSYLDEFGFGKKLGTEFSNELSGILKSSAYFDSYHKKGGWKALTVISMAIGQGELGTTPLQMANMTAAIANRGYYYIPHIVKSIGNDKKINPKFMEKHVISIDSLNFEAVILGMEAVVNGGPGGTARSVAMSDIIICGKTGTAENPFGEDHSVFIAFAPKDNPKIAIAAYVENAGFGATYAAPVASLMIERYLKNEIAANRKWLEDRVLNLNLIDSIPEVETEH
jgi:penicillin-binding protein 2